MRIAVVGSGVSGMVAAWLLQREHEVVVFEAASRFGGHVNTVTVRRDDGVWPVDTGFIVFNPAMYPRFVRLLDRLGVASQQTSMSFGVRCERTGLEYASHSLGGFFADRRNLLRPCFYRMAGDLVRLGCAVPALAGRNGDAGALTLGEWLVAKGFSRELVEHFVVPMGAAIWSADPTRMLEFPAQSFARFLHNHRMLRAWGQPVWRVIRGGSRTYMEVLARPFRDRIRLHAPVRRIRRRRGGVTVEVRGMAPERFDHVIVAVHSDQALRMLADPSDAETDVLSAIPYQPNATVLHTDTRLLPRRPRARASWNYHVPREPRRHATVTYDMKRLQRLPSRDTFCVTLNGEESIDPAATIERFDYHHPVFTAAGIAAQARHARISGVARTHFCGAYWGDGFHEDGVASALAVARRFGQSL